ncbi:hypothetical protein FHE72_23090 [Rossellomorea vietnamensis]|uniref:Uncharacterized protein n=1 Tax=Rossellomorea vietnamensis TaxID=218284 RepID=A0A6I6UKH1_9BACI|nr:hypothetical protein [Rossellomorea vietnamensis]QHE63555.1 hypothetical protein FHE72_23090 [Rossellomorea vietnamensis]
MKDIDDMTRVYLSNMQLPKENRRNVIGFLILLLDFLGLLPLLSIPFSSSFFWATLAPAVFIHVWGILYIVAPYKFEHSYYLYIGIFGIVNTYVFFLVIQKLLYLHIGVDSSRFFYIGLVLMVFLLVFIQVFHVKMLYSGTYVKIQNGKSPLTISSIVAFSTFGYVAAQFLMSYMLTDSAFMILLMMVYSVVSIVTAYLSTFIHRYIYIQRNKEKVLKMYPDFGKLKDSRKFG